MKEKRYYQHNVIIPNHKRGTNNLFGLLPSKLDDVFNTITDNDETLDTLYINERYESNNDVLFPTPFNVEFGDRFGDNEVKFFNSKNGKWTGSQSRNNIVKIQKQSVRDPAEKALIEELYYKAKLIENTQSQTKLGILPPTDFHKRALFLLGGVGTGKTTLLHHVSRITLPKLWKNNKVPFEVIVIPVNCDPKIESDSTKEVWENSIQIIRKQIGRATGLNTVKGWEKISHHSIYEDDGSYRPEITYDPRGIEKAKKSTIFKLKNNHIEFIKRASSYLWHSKERKIIVVALDNIDRNEIPWNRQLAMCDRLLTLLDSCRCLLGILPAREYTLGNFEQMSSAQRYHHLDRLHITTPIIGKALQERLSFYIKKNAEKLYERNKVFKLSTNIRVSFSDFSGIINSLGKSLDDHSIERTSGKRLPESTLRKLRFSNHNFLLNISNADLRATLQMVLYALRSWALEVESSLMHYMYTKDKYGSPDFPAFTLDELTRLLCIGESERYFEGNGSGIINVYGDGGSRPMEGIGRFPALIRSRVLEYFDRFGSGGKTSLIEMKEFISRMRIFSYTPPQVKKMVSMFIDQGFIESPEGNKISNIKTFLKTKKTYYYLNPFSKLLVYLENMRNDTMIYYDSEPHEARSNIFVDFIELMKYIDFILVQEMDEWNYINCRDKKKKNTKGKEIYVNWFLGQQPICWRLLRSVVGRVNQLFRNENQKVSEENKKQMIYEFQSLRKKIQSADKEGRIMPPIPASKKRLFLDLKY